MLVNSLTTSYDTLGQNKIVQPMARPRIQPGMEVFWGMLARHEASGRAVFEFWARWVARHDIKSCVVPSTKVARQCVMA